MAETGVETRKPMYAACTPRQAAWAVQGAASEHGRVCARKQLGLVREISSNSSTTFDQMNLVRRLTKPISATRTSSRVDQPCVAQRQQHLGQIICWYFDSVRQVAAQDSFAGLACEMSESP